MSPYFASDHVKFVYDLRLHATKSYIHACIGKDSAGQQIIFNQESEETNSVNSPDKAEKSDISLTMINS